MENLGVINLQFVNIFLVIFLCVILDMNSQLSTILGQWRYPEKFSGILLTYWKRVV